MPGLFVLAAFGAAYLLLRPTLRRLGPKRRGLAVAALLAASALVLIGLRLVPVGLIALVMAGGAALRGFTTEPEADEGGGVAGMSRAEARRVLGLPKGHDAADVEAAHRRAIRRVHPDRGGSDAQAAMVNEAREVLRR